jgi:transposase
MQSEGTHMELKVLHQHGWSISRLAREFDVSRVTVRRELAADGPRHYPERTKPTALTDAQQAHVLRRLAVCPVIRGTDLHRELCTEYGYGGSYGAFARHLRLLRPPRAPEAEVRFETEPGRQVQVDWMHVGVMPVEDGCAPLFGLVALLGHSRVPAIRFALDRTRATTLDLIPACLEDLGGAPHEILTDRDPAFCVGSTKDGHAILAPEWVDLCATLAVVPKACRPYRAKTKGKVERVIREYRESFLPWLAGQVLPGEPTLEDYNRLARQWREEVILPRIHRTTKQRIGDAWRAEQPFLCPLPTHLMVAAQAARPPVYPPSVIDLAARRAGDEVEVRDLREYEAAL